MPKFHLAQINIAQAKYPLEAEQMSGFTKRLDEINAIADQSEGFVWRLQTEEGDATSLRIFPDLNLIVNLSVWENIQSLQKFIYQSTHLELMREKANWFNKLKKNHLALWWIPCGSIPTLDEAKDRLVLLDQHGPTTMAFTVANNFPATG